MYNSKDFGRSISIKKRTKARKRGGRRGRDGEKFQALDFLLLSSVLVLGFQYKYIKLNKPILPFPILSLSLSPPAPLPTSKKKGQFLTQSFPTISVIEHHHHHQSAPIELSSWFSTIITSHIESELRDLNLLSWLSLPPLLPATCTYPHHIEAVPCLPEGSHPARSRLSTHRRATKFRHVISPLSSAGYRSHQPLTDRGAGLSSKPRASFAERAMAVDLFQLVHERLGVREKVHVFGHDIRGSMRRLLMRRGTGRRLWLAGAGVEECQLPRMKAFEQVKQRHWHFAFHR